MGTAPCPSAAAGHTRVAHGNGGLRQGPCHTRDEPEQRAAVRRAGCCEESRQDAMEHSSTGGRGGVQAPWFFFEEMKCSGTGQGYGWATLNTPNATGLPTFQESVT